MKKLYLPLLLVLVACSSGDDGPTEPGETQTFDEVIAAGGVFETVDEDSTLVNEETTADVVGDETYLCTTRTVSLTAWSSSSSHAVSCSIRASKSACVESSRRIMRPPPQPPALPPTHRALSDPTAWAKCWVRVDSALSTLGSGYAMERLWPSRRWQSRKLQSGQR